MVSHNSTSENGVGAIPEDVHNHSQSVSNISSRQMIWEIGLHGGQQLARYYLDLVKLCLDPLEVKSNNQVSISNKLRERLEIEEYTKNFQKQR